MDINKYIGQFLLKNKYCSLPGLGVFDLKKEIARASTTDDTISAPKYSITFTPVGSIDDTFASFIATAENVSISNASNNIREYCKMVKEELAKKGTFDIEHLGQFMMSNSKIGFRQSNDLDLGSEPAPLPPLLEKQKTAEQASSKPDYSYPPAKSYKKDLPVMKIAIGVLLLIVLGAGAWFAYSSLQNNKSSEPEETITPIPVQTQVDTLPKAVDSNLNAATTTVDSLHKDSTSAATTVTTPVASTGIQGNMYNVAILSFDNEVAANSKAAKLKKYGNNASVVNKDGKFIVTIAASHPLNDTTKLVDSLRRFFNPKGSVYILK